MMSDNLEKVERKEINSSKSPFEGIKTLFDLQHSDIRQALRETREEN